MPAIHIMLLRLILNIIFLFARSHTLASALCTLHFPNSPCRLLNTIPTRKFKIYLNAQLFESHTRNSDVWFEFQYKQYIHSHRHRHAYYGPYNLCLCTSMPSIIQVLLSFSVGFKKLFTHSHSHARTHTHTWQNHLLIIFHKNTFFILKAFKV